MMGRFIEMKEKQAEDEMAEKEKARTNASEEYMISQTRPYVAQVRVA